MYKSGQALRIPQVADPCLVLLLTALQTPFLLLPFRPSTDASAARTFIRNYFNQSLERGSPLSGDALAQELRLSDPMVSQHIFFLPPDAEGSFTHWYSVSVLDRSCVVC